MAMPPALVNPRSPISGLMPMSTAPAAPAKPMCESACAAKADWRSTMKYPMTPATTATIVPASKACRIKSYRHITCRSPRRFQLNIALFMVMNRLFCADDGYPAAGTLHDLDRDAV